MKLLRRIECHVFGHSDEWSLVERRLRCVDCGAYGQQRFTAQHREWMLANGELSRIEDAISQVAQAIIGVGIAVRDAMIPMIEKLAQAFREIDEEPA